PTPTRISPSSSIHSRLSLPPPPIPSNSRRPSAWTPWHLVAAEYLPNTKPGFRFFRPSILEFGDWIFPVPCHLLASRADSGYIPSLIYKAGSIQKKGWEERISNREKFRGLTRSCPY